MRGVAQARSIFKFYKYGLFFLFYVNVIRAAWYVMYVA